jgi:pyruvate kinase
MARKRPCAPIVGITPQTGKARRLSLFWGIHSVLCKELVDATDVSELACKTIRAEMFGGPGQTVVISAGMPFGKPGTMNHLRTAQIQ